MKKIDSVKRVSVLIISFFSPYLLFAQNIAVKGASTGNRYMEQLVANILSPLLGLATMIAFIYFLFGVTRFFYEGQQNEEARMKLKKHLLWGMVGLFIVFSIGGILSVLMKMTDSL